MGSKHNEQGFTNVPFTWSAREDISLTKRVIVGYIYTRSNIEGLEWGLVAADIRKVWGLGKSTVSKIMTELESEGVIEFAEWRRISGDFPSKVFKINRLKLEALMAQSEPTVHPENRRSSASEPPQFIRRTATVPPVNLEEEGKEELNKKSLEEEEKLERQVPYENPSKPTSKSSVIDKFLSKTPSEQAELLDAVDANKTLEQDLRAGKDVRMTAKFTDYFANL